LRFNDIRRSAPCRILEEEFHRPSLLVDFGDGQRRKREVVGQELQALAGLRIAIGDAAQRIRIRRSQTAGSENDRVVAAQAGGLVDRARITPLQQNVGFGAHHKECRLQREAI
jgi:hypothetical protein